MTAFMQFSDKMVTYDTFINDVANRVCSIMKSDRNDPEYVSKTKAYKMCGRANVERWQREGKIQPRIRPGKHEYPTAKLRELQRTIQDYL